MTSQPLELEGTWEEIVAHAPELAGRRVRLIVLPDVPEAPTPKSHSTAQSLLKFAGTWKGEDVEECLQMVYDTRSPLEF